MTPACPGVVAVTGATGFIGRYLCDHFRGLGWDVRALARTTSTYPFATEGIQIFSCDLPDRVDEDALNGAEVLVHCAYMTRYTELAAAKRVNELGTRKLLELARSRGVDRFVFLSSQSAHDEAESYYGRSKLELEKLFLPDRDVIFRSGLVLGKAGAGLFHRMCDMVRQSRILPLFGGGHQLIQTIHVQDLCRATEEVVRKELTGLFTVAEPRAMELRKFLRAIAARLGRRPLFVPFPMSPALTFLRTLEALRFPFPVSSENLLGLKCLRATETTEDLDRLGITVRSASESLDEILGPGPDFSA